MLALTIGFAGCARGPEPHQLEAQLRRELPPGTPSSQVEAYLTARGWRHSYLPGERSYLAGIINVGPRFSLTREDIAIRIDMNKRGRVTAISVTPFFTYHGR
ncbi:MAG TPA: hypothetical protein VGI29_06880 [Candidatus Binataceae bacterium]|jgi:hypothetical protein